MSSFQVSFQTQCPGRPWWWGQAVLDRPSKANLEKKEYSIERTGFWKNQVTFITSKLEALNNGNREKGLLTSTQYFREVQDGIY